MRPVVGFLSDELKQRIISQAREVFANIAWRFTIRTFFPCCKSMWEEWKKTDTRFFSQTRS